MLKHYRLLLAGIGDYSVEFYRNGKDVAENYKNHMEKPKIIIRDHRMHVKNGRTFYIKCYSIS